MHEFYDIISSQTILKVIFKNNLHELVNAGDNNNNSDQKVSQKGT